MAAGTVLYGATDVIEAPRAGAHIIETGRELEIAPVGGRQQFGERAQAVDRLLDGGQLPLGAPATVYHLAVVLEEGDVVGDRLEAKRVKTDRIDLRGLLRMLIRFSSGEVEVWSVVNVPSPRPRMRATCTGSFSRLDETVRE